MLTRREILERNCSQELAYVESAIDWERFFEGSYTAQDAREALVNSILNGFKRGRGRQAQEVFRDEKTVSLRDTSFFKLAQIVKTEYVNTWGKFKEELSRKIPNYSKSPRGVLNLLGLPWKLKFTPPKQMKRPKMTAINEKRRKEKGLPPKPGLRELPKTDQEQKKEYGVKIEPVEVSVDTFQEMANLAVEEKFNKLNRRIDVLIDYMLMAEFGEKKADALKRLIGEK